MKRFFIFLFVSLIAFSCETEGPFDRSLFHSTFKEITYTTEDGDIISKDPADWQLSLDSPYQDIFAPYQIVEGEVPAPSNVVIPHSYNMQPVYPNPSSDSLTFCFSLMRKASVLIIIIDSDRRIIKNVADFVVGAGYHTFNWNLKNNRDNRVPSDIYRCIYRLGPLMGYGDLWIK